jgi:hypothetical protein
MFALNRWRTISAFFLRPLSVVVPGFNLAPELHGRDAHNSTEDLREMTLIGEAGRRSRAGQGDLRIAQVLLRAFNSAPQDVLVWGQACAYLE